MVAQTGRSAQVLEETVYETMWTDIVLISGTQGTLFLFYSFFLLQLYCVVIYVLFPHLKKEKKIKKQKRTMMTSN